MTYKIKVGLDPELMVTYGPKDAKQYVYPILGTANPAFEGLAKSECMRLSNALRRIGMDDFGHCIELRPEEAASGQDVVFNLMREFRKLPDEFNYYGENTHLMPKAVFIKAVRSAGRKTVSECRNVYGVDVLDDCPADIEARKNGQRLVFCGTHMHVSATKKVTIGTGGDAKSEHKIVALPMKTLTALFDTFLFSQLAKDSGANIGRYRQPGFYEPKDHGGFEYRSLGASALTPKRICLISDIIIELTKFVLDPENVDALMFSSLNAPKDAEKIALNFPKVVDEMAAELKSTRAVSTDLHKLWVNF